MDRRPLAPVQPPRERGRDELSIWVLTNAPSPYQMELLRSVMDHSNVSLHVRLMRSGGELPRKVDLPAGSSVRVMRGWGLLRARDELRLHWQAVRETVWGDDDCFVLSGLWTSMTFLTCAAVLTLRRRRWVAWLERPHGASGAEGQRPKDVQISVAADEVPTLSEVRGVGDRPERGRGWRRADVVRWVRDRVRGWVLSRAWQVWCIGSAAREAYADLGVDDERLRVLPYCCDVERFAAVAPDEIESIRARHNLRDRVVFLFSGQMVPRKGVDTLLEAFARLSSARPETALLLLGDGPHRPQYEQSVPQHLRDRVHFAGFRQQAQLPAYFRAADAFVFPSRHDGWGVVINEACAASLPVIATCQTGAGHDLVEDGRSGFLVNCDDPTALAERMEWVAADPVLRQRFGRRSRELVEPFSATNGALLFLENVHGLLAGSTRPGMKAVART